ncbi:rho GTPase-activating protein Graf isoform X3 [Helicoverpa armigera]|uniref:rho GTPase-activating protein Graf isoform X3 n=1 Tax=Helicoverpa armigera TaxID=29058 RepID=UPI003082B9F7
MGVGLQPLEFTECLADSPQFRENLQRHEKELERTSQQIKRLIKEVKDVVQAAKPGARTRADHPAARALPQGAHRRRQGGQEEVRQEDCQVLPEPGAHALALHQEAGGRLPGGGRGDGHGGARLLPGVAGVRVPAAGGAGAQEVRAGGDAAGLRVRLVDLPPHRARRARRRRAARQGLAAAHPAEAFGTTTWSKQYCTYEKASRQLSLTPYNQMNVKTSGGTEALAVCGARACAEPVERRFCWECVPDERERPALVLQALGERDRAAWLAALREPGARAAPPAPPPAPAALDDAGFAFVRRVLAAIEARGLEEQGLYRVAGVASKVARLVACAAPGRRLPPLDDPLHWETKTLTSALKSYLRALPDPLLTRALHAQFLAVAKCERRGERAAGVAALVRALPPHNREMLTLVLRHLRKVAARSDKNLMSASNLAVCFGPTLLRAERETVASILELKFYNVLVETLLELPDDLAPPPHAPHQPPHQPPHLQPLRTSPTAMASAGAGERADVCVQLCERVLAPRYSPQHATLLAQMARPGRSSSSSAESVSSPGASPLPARGVAWRVRTLYACLGESEGELSFEPNQIITNVSASGEPGWLRGTLNGKTGLVPENYVEPLP